jgi:hypothetical protein
MLYNSVDNTNHSSVTPPSCSLGAGVDALEVCPPFFFTVFDANLTESTFQGARYVNQRSRIYQIKSMVNIATVGHHGYTYEKLKKYIQS